MTIPEEPSSGLPPHLDPRGRKGPPPRVTNAYRQAARGGPAATRPSTPGPGEPLGPPGSTPRRSGRRRTARILSWVALSTAVVVLLGAGGLWIAFNHYNGQISRIAIPGIDGHAQPAKAPRNAENFLLVGSDSRAGSNGDGTQGAGATYVTGQRSDTVILVHLFGSSDKAELVSFPRDSYVTIPRYTDPKTGRVTSEHKDKLNSAFSEGGPALLIATVENLSNIRIDHFMQIDFTGFKGMVNKLGGVDVCLTKAAKDHFSGIDLPAGKHHIDGNVALSFVRQRHGLALGDIDRIARQQQFLGSLVHKVLSAGTLLNPLKLNGFLDVATSSLQVDKGLSGNDLKDLALRLRSFSSGGVLFTTIPIADIGGHINGADVVLLDAAKDEALFSALRNDQAPAAPGAPSTPAGPTAPAAALTMAPSAIRVAVFNGSGVAGVGRKAATDLGALKFGLVGIATNRGTGATGTVIHYGPTKADSARTLQAALPGSVLLADGTLDRTLEVIVGSDYSSNPAHAVTISSAPTTSPSSGTPTAPVKTAADNSCTT